MILGWQHTLSTSNSRAPARQPLLRLPRLPLCACPPVTKELVEIQRHEALADEPEHPGKQVGAGRFRNSVQRHDD